jgi:hypothetical protein
VLIALKPGGQIHEHHADSAITVQGVQGRVEFTVGERKAELVPGGHADEHDVCAHVAKRNETVIDTG